VRKFYLFILFISTAIFGVSYVFLSYAAEYLSPFTINAFRFGIGIICFLPFCFKHKISNFKSLFWGSILLGLTLVVSPYFQQLVSNKLSTGIIGFISSMYLVIVPIIEFFIFKRKLGLKIWLSILLAYVGLFILFDIKEFKINIYELLLLVVALFFAFEIIIVDRFTIKNDAMHLMTGAFILSFIINLICALLFETSTIENIKNALPYILFLGVVVSVIGYGLQGIGQKEIDSVTSTLVLSLESVISVFCGWIFFKQTLTLNEWIGCLVIFIGVTLSQYFSLKDK